MKFGREDVQNILSQFDAGFQPIQILNGLYRSGFTEWLELAAVEQCLRENGRQIPPNNKANNAAHGHQSHSAGHASNPSASTNHAAPDPPAAANHQGARQVSAYASVVVQNTTTHAPPLYYYYYYYYDPGPTMTWNDLADRFTMSAHRFGKSVDEIWATLRSNG